MSSEFVHEVNTQRSKEDAGSLGVAVIGPVSHLTWVWERTRSSARVAGTLNPGHPFSPYVILSRKTFLFTLWLDEVALEAMKEPGSDDTFI